MNKKIKDLQQIIDNNLYHFNQILFKRKCKMNFTDIFFYLTQLIHNKSASSVTVYSKIM